MKFGVVIHKPTMNLGDDIQTYAAATGSCYHECMVDVEKMELAACRLYYPQITEHAY